MGNTTRIRTVLLTGLLVLPLAACSAEPEKETAAVTKKPRPTVTVPKAAPANIEKIAALTGCTPEIRIQAAELREGVCSTAQGQWTVTTFPAEKYKTVWLDSARMYGGTYLVGPQWAVGGKQDVLAALRTKLGGEITSLRNPAPRGSTS